MDIFIDCIDGQTRQTNNTAPSASVGSQGWPRPLRYNAYQTLKLKSIKTGLLLADSLRNRRWKKLKGKVIPLILIVLNDVNSFISPMQV